VTVDTERDVTLQGTVVEAMPDRGSFKIDDGTGSVCVLSSETPAEDACVRLGGVVTDCSSRDAEYCVSPERVIESFTGF
jgi:hypothetical protein